MSNTTLVENLIKKFIKIHGNKYEYTKVVYPSNHGKIIITCPIHGDFSQSIKHHFVGNGCPKCELIKKKEINNKEKNK